MKKILILVFAALAFGAFFYFDLHTLLTFESIKEKQAEFTGFKERNLFLTIGVFCAVYITSTALSLPGALILTLLSGALFGLGLGTLLVSFSSTMGATLAFLASRFLLQKFVQTKFGEALNKINAGIEREGAFYLFSLRLIPLFPFFLINLVMGLTKIKTPTYMWVSALGMLPGTIAYVNAGTRLSELESPSGVLSPAVLLSFAVLGLVPFVSKKIIELLRSKQNA